MAKPKTAVYRMLGSKTEGPIRQFLTDRDMEIGDLATKTGLSRKTVSIHVNGAPMSWDVLSRIALALGVAPGAIAEPIPDNDTEAAVSA